MPILARLRDNSLWSRCVRACSWAVLGGASVQAIGMLRFFILAYLLVPEDFGILVLVRCVIGLVQEFSDTGIRHALIQNPRGLQQEYLDGAWVLNLLRNAFLVAGLYLGAPLIAVGIYARPELVGLLRVSCLVLVFNGLTSVSLTVLRKQLQLRPVALVRAGGQAAGTVATVLLAWRWPRAESVVWGEVCTAGILCLLSYAVHPYRPRLSWQWSVGRELIGYGVLVWLNTMVDALGCRLDVLLLGLAGGDYEVGVYGLGLAAVLVPVGVFSMVTASVGFPALSMLQHDVSALRRGVSQIVRTGQTFVLPVFGVLGLLGPDIVRVLPAKYAEVGETIRWLSIAGVCLVFTRLLAPALYAIKRVYWVVVRGLLHVLVLSCILLPLYGGWGVVGICWGVNLALLTGSVFLWLMVLHELRWSRREWFRQTRGLWQAMATGGIGFCLAYLGAEWVGWGWSEHLWIRLAVVAVALAGYVISYMWVYGGAGIWARRSLGRQLEANN